MIIKDLRNNPSAVLEIFKVKASDRKIPGREKKCIELSLWSQSVFKQKVDYIHANPVVAGTCKFAKECKYSSASFYLRADSK